MQTEATRLERGVHLSTVAAPDSVLPFSFHKLYVSMWRVLLGWTACLNATSQESVRIYNNHTATAFTVNQDSSCSPGWLSISAGA